MSGGGGAFPSGGAGCDGAGCAGTTKDTEIMSRPSAFKAVVRCRKRAQLGAPKAVTATARKLGCLIYRHIKNGQGLGDRKVEVDFGGGYLSSDGGGLILRELERQSGLLRDFAGCFVDNRDQRYIEHSVQELISQRIHGLVLGYEDLIDHDHLRLDPIHANTVNDQACNRVKELFHWQQS